MAFTIEQRLVGLGLHDTKPEPGKTLTFTIDELKKFLAMIDANTAQKDRVGVVRFLSMPEDLKEEDIRLLMNEALGEFVAARSSPEEYVAKRYPELIARDAKIEEVRKRIGWVKQMVEHKTVRVELQYACGYCGCPEPPRDDLYPGQDYPRCPECQGC